MPNNEYKKRSKGNWRQGKGYKGDGKERVYAREDIVEDLRATHEDHRTPHKNKKKNLKARLEYWITWYTQKLEEKGQYKSSDSFDSLLKEGLERAKKEYEEKYGGK